jgi:hypothetical protein
LFIYSLVGCEGAHCGIGGDSWEGCSGGERHTVSSVQCIDSGSDANHVSGLGSTKGTENDGRRKELNNCESEISSIKKCVNWFILCIYCSLTECLSVIHPLNIFIVEFFNC